MRASPRQLAAMLGIESFEEVGNMPRRYYELIWQFSSLADGSTTEITVKNDSSAAFWCDQIVGAAYLAATVASTGLAGTLLNRVPSPNTGTGANAVPNLQGVQVLWYANNYYSAQVRGLWPNRVGTIENPYIPLWSPIIPPGAQVVYQIYNGSGTTISGEITWAGSLIQASALRRA